MLLIIMCAEIGMKVVVKTEKCMKVLVNNAVKKKKD